LPFLTLVSKGYGTLDEIKYKWSFVEFREVQAYEQLKNDIEQEQYEAAKRGDNKKSFS
jgi:hypothetical protein